MENKIQEVLKSVADGKEVTHSGWFDLDADDRAIDRKVFEQYIPGLIYHLDEGEDENHPYSALNLLLKIFPDEPDLELADWILWESYKEYRNQIELLKLIALIKLPEGANLDPIIDMADDRKEYLASFAIKAFKAVHAEEAERVLLKRLREVEWKGIVKHPAEYCEALGAVGSISSIPVLMAVRLDYSNESYGHHFDAAIEQILEREAFDDELKQHFKDPDFWKPKWQSSPEEFAGFVTMMGMIGIPGALNDPKLIDTLAEIYMKEMDVDIAPYQSFEALRLCSSVDDYILSKHDQLKFALNEASLFSMIGETGVMPCITTIAKDILLDLMTDYFMTGLRRHISFAKKQEIE